MNRRAGRTAVGGRSLGSGSLSQSERGAATVVGLAAVVAVLAVFVVAVQLGAAVVTRHRAEAAADLSALAGAAHAISGPDGACATARRVTDRMAVRLVSCELRGWEMSVLVEAVPPGPLRRFGVVRATACAGPTSAERRVEDASRRAVGPQR